MPEKKKILKIFTGHEVDDDGELQESEFDAERYEMHQTLDFPQYLEWLKENRKELYKKYMESKKSKK